MPEQLLSVQIVTIQTKALLKQEKYLREKFIFYESLKRDMSWLLFIYSVLIVIRSLIVGFASYLICLIYRLKMFYQWLIVVGYLRQIHD